MWVKYTGKLTYNSMEVRGFKPNTSRSVSDEVGKYLLKEFPKLFHPSKPIVEVEDASKDEKEENSKDEKKEDKK